MSERIAKVKEMVFEINGLATEDFKDDHFEGEIVTVVVKKRMTESQAMEK